MANVTMFNPAMDSSDRHVDVFFPAEAGSYPLIAYAHGLDNRPSDYTRLFRGLVSFGFVVACHRACHTGCHDDKSSLPLDPDGYAHYYKQQLLVIEWARQQAAGNSSSVFAQKVNFTQGVAAAGHSMGGQSTVFCSSYRNASAVGIAAMVTHHAYTHQHPAPTVPFLLMTGKKDDVAAAMMSSKVFRAEGGNATKGLVNKREWERGVPQRPPAVPAHAPAIRPTDQ